MRNSKEIEFFGKRLKQLRKDADLTQDALAFDAEVDRKTIRRIEKGQHAITLDLIVSLSKSLRIQPSKFFEGLEIEFED